MKQTAMQEHIEWLKATIEIAQEQTPILVNVLKLCLNDATQRLAMEKEQIEEALLTGLVHWNVDKPISEYYNETYQINKK